MRTCVYIVAIKGSGAQAFCLLICCAVVGGMQELLEVRAADDQQDVGARIRKTVQSWLPAFSLTKADNQNTQI